MMSWNLQKWPVLHHLTFGQLCDISYLVIYGDKGPNDYGTAVYITKGGLVYATGVNSYCGSYSKQTEIIKDGGNFLKGSVKVEALSELGVKKIVQGSGFGIGQTSSNYLYLWGNTSSSMMLRKEYTVLYECFKPDTVCEKCTVGHYSPCTIGGFTLNKCETCEWYPTRCIDSPNNPKTPVKKFMEFCDMVVVLCSKCRQWCSFLGVGDYDLFYCASCNILQESTGWCDESSTPRKVELEESLKVVDIACGESFFVVQTASNNLLLYGYMGCWLQGYVNNPDDVIIQSVSCGGTHLAVISNKEELYTAGVGSLGQLGYKWDETMGFSTLRKVALPGAALKVCCGFSSTACLRSDGSIIFFGGSMSGNKPPMIHTLNQYTFTDIACATLTDLFSAKTVSSEVYFWRSPTPKLHLKVDACNNSIDGLVGWPVVYNAALSEMVFMEQMDPCVQHGSSHYAEFYGQKLLSDLTLKLRDEDFPVHRIVLYNNSVYFKNLFAKFTNDEVLDMTSHDPGTYRNLLKCFYKALGKELEWRELLDLHLLAKSYNESIIETDSLNKLLYKLNDENIEEVTNAAKSNSLKCLLDECERKRRFSKLLKMAEKRYGHKNESKHQASKSVKMEMENENDEFA